MNITDIQLQLQKAFKITDFASVDTINGIQIQNSNKAIRNFAVSVDSSLPVMEALFHLQKKKVKIDALFVHHGIYWGKVEPITQDTYKKVKILLDNDIALYALHLPLDAHQTLGNNAQLAKRLKLQQCKPFGSVSNVKIGIQGNLTSTLSVEQVIKRLFSSPKFPTDSYAGFAHKYGLEPYAPCGIDTKKKRILLHSTLPCTAQKK